MKNHVERDNARFDREYDRPGQRPFVPDASDLEAGECDVCGEKEIVDFNAHNRDAFKRHLEITGELHVLNCPVCGKPTDPDVDEFVTARGWFHADCWGGLRVSETVKQLTREISKSALHLAKRSSEEELRRLEDELRLFLLRLEES
jgi:hypothetical protein